MRRKLCLLLVLLFMGSSLTAFSEKEHQRTIPRETINGNCIYIGGLCL